MGNNHLEDFKKSTSINGSDYADLLKSLVKINEEFTRNNLQMESCASNLEKTLYKMTHDLYSPLSNVEGLVNILKINECYKDESSKVIIDMISDAVQKFKVRIKEVANVASAFPQNSQVGCESLNEMLDLIKVKFNNIIEASNAIIESDFIVQSNSLCFESNYCILHNLISQGLKDRQEDSRPQIHLKTYEEKGYSVIEMREDKRFTKSLSLKDLELTTITPNESISGIYIIKKIAENAGGGLELTETTEGTIHYKVYFK